MKNFVVQSGDFITTSGIYQMNDHPRREITLIYGDAVPTFQGKTEARRKYIQALDKGAGF